MEKKITLTEEQFLEASIKAMQMVSLRFKKVSQENGASTYRSIGLYADTAMAGSFALNELGRLLFKEEGKE